MKTINYGDESVENIIRQIRSFNENGDIESMTRGALDGNGKYTEYDSGSIVYQYDKDGNKKVALYEDDIVGVEYFEYDKEGNIKLSISDDHIMQHVKDGEKEYDICDGYFKPSNNGFTYLSHGSMYDIEANKIKRTVFGNISRKEINSIIDELGPKRQEEVIDILRIMEPIFEYASTYNSLDGEKREKIISWFKGFSKDLKIDDRKKENHTAEKIANGINVREEQINEIQGETIKAVEEQKDKEEQSFGGE